jgi:site-specific DNA-methyltransferase (adenine-specific)
MSEPYYSDDLVALYHGDCREVTDWLEADVLITDPPYGIDGHLSAGFKGEKPAAGHVRVNAKPAWDATLEARDAALALWGGGEALCGVRIARSTRRRAPLSRVPARVGQGERRHG